MKILQKRELEKLEEYEKVGVQAFERLRNMLHIDQARQQNFSLRIKR